MNRTKAITIRLTETELRHLKAKAGVRGLSALLRLQALGPDRQQEQKQRLSLLAEIARVRHALNQIARRCEEQAAIPQLDIVARLVSLERRLVALR